MVRLRLQRLGKKKQPFYRIVAIDSHKKNHGSYLGQALGTYWPQKEAYKVEADAVLKWLQQGAQPSETVAAILRKEGILAKFHAWRVEQRHRPALVTTQPAEQR